MTNSAFTRLPVFDSTGRLEQYAQVPVLLLDFFGVQTDAETDEGRKTQRVTEEGSAE